MGKCLAHGFGTLLKLFHRRAKDRQQRHVLGLGAVLVGQQRFVEHRQRQLVETQRPLHWVGVQAVDQSALADDDSGLAAAEQLVAGERHQIRAIGEQLARRGFRRQIEPSQIR